MEILEPRIPYQNVHPIERWASLLGGLVVIARGLRRPPAPCIAHLAAGAGLIHRGLTGRCEVYRMLGVRTEASTSTLPYELGIRARAAVTINQSRETVFASMRNFQQFPRFMRHLKSVEPLGDGRSHWVAEGPLGSSVSWDAEIINEISNELIAWKSLPGSQVDHAGSLRFADAPGQRGTEVRVEMQYNPPAGIVGAYVARLFGREPEQEIAADMRRLKQYLECGEVARTDNQSRGGAALQSEIVHKWEQVSA